MGKVEKIVVLSVVFLIVVILVVATQGGGKDEAPQAEAGKSRSMEGSSTEAGTNSGVVLAAEPSTGGERGRRPEVSSSAPSSGPGLEAAAAGEGLEENADAVDPLVPGGRLAVGDRGAGARTGAGAPLADPRGDGLQGAPSKGARGSATPAATIGAPARVEGSIPADWDLKTLVGLSDHAFVPEIKIYTATQGDTFDRLAERYFGDARFVAALQRNNEGVSRLADGQQVLVPVHASLPEPAAADASATDPGLYVVQEGENLWKIAKKVYGAGHRWGEIYEANRDRLAHPDAVAPGLALRIP